MKKVLFLIPTLGGGGAERVLVNLVNNLKKDKYDKYFIKLFVAFLFCYNAIKEVFHKSR